MSDLSALATLTPEELEAVKYLGANQGKTDPSQLPGRPQVWKVDNKFYVAYFIPGTKTPLVWSATPEELTKQFGGIDATTPPPVDRTMTGAEFQAMAPWQAGLINEIRLTGTDANGVPIDFDNPWTQFFATFQESARLRPWLNDPDMLATVATAFLEGRTPTPDEIAQTEWWNTHTDAERQWLEQSVTAGTREIEQRRRDMRRLVTNTMLGLGLKNVNPKIIDIIADKRLTGQWSEQYTNEQLKKLADPFAVGELHSDIAKLVTDVNMRQSRMEEDTVRQMASQWLGPTLGQMSDRDIERWAGRLRNNPDAKVEFEEFLRNQRMALFPNYTNPNLTYEDIVSPFRNLASNIWGRPVTDETMLVDLANLGDYTEASKRLRKQGLDMGVQKVVYDALADMSATPAGERVVRSAI